MEYELDEAEKIELRILADAGVPVEAIADEMDLSLEVVDWFLYEGRGGRGG